MKHLFVVFTLLVTIMSAIGTQAAEDAIMLDDATPAIDALITLPTDTTGAISVELAGASLTLYDNTGEIALQVADARVHSVQFNILPNTGDHTLRLERLENIDKASVTVTSISEFLVQPSAQQVNSSMLSLDQSTDVVLNNITPNSLIDVNIPSDALGVFTVNTPNNATMSQLTDADGGVVATSMRGHIDGLSLLLDGGDYQYTLLGINLVEDTTATVRVTPYDSTQNPLLFVPETETGVIAETNAVETTEVVSNIRCNAEIFVSSVNLRSGPGTGYSVLNYGFFNDVFPVGGTNPTDKWIVVGLPDGDSAWMTKAAANLSGDCSTLSVFDVPYREAQQAEVVVVQADPIIQEVSAVVVQPQQTYTQNTESNSNNSNNNKHREDDDHDDDHDDHDDHDDDD